YVLLRAQSDAALAQARGFQRKAQFYLDFRGGRKPRWASTPRRKRRASWESRLTSRGKDKTRFVKPQ
ncbi:MAG: hypothetical protein WKF84_22215, partial [Pyrinomonadaceae bacterium]